MNSLNSYVERSRSGGFLLRAEGGVDVRVTPEGAQWTVSGTDRLEGARLSRSTAGGFVLNAADGTEIGRSSRIAPEARGGAGSSILLEDGRLFLLAGRGPARPGLDLCGWETPGPYLTATPESGGWRIAPTAAGVALPPADALAVLFAAELLDAEQPR